MNKPKSNNSGDDYELFWAIMKLVFNFLLIALAIYVTIRCTS